MASFPLADLNHRENGSYEAAQTCLVCSITVDATKPHIFVRDADQSLDDSAALVGLLHTGCEQQYIEDAKGSGGSSAQLRRNRITRLMNEGFKLELIHEGSSGYRHHLDGRAVHAGTVLELRTDNGWTSSRYEWSYNTESPAFLVVDSETDEAVTLDSYSVLRWPSQ